ncbi:DUF1501 domain-containing protein, partial [Akkermansiaceae bacterium]|nr:DUF1501 domain-containing protein [Akkermansiaceae bacterium]MDC0277848.1 DUF1501 domain-containing protein [Akkermansiaceae bacterium]
MKDTFRKFDDIDRRGFLTGTAAAALGVTILPDFAVGEESEIIKPASHATAKNVIFLYMAGGMPHVDTFDPKIPSEIAGGSSPISTSANGLQISNHLPQMAKQADKFAVVRSMTTK